MAGPTVRFEEWLSMDALREAYRTCRALIQAHEEDFGIAPLEAMACGRPVIALRRGGAGEVVPPFAGVLFDEPTDDALERAIEAFDARVFDAASLRRHALLFDREVYRSRMRELLEEAVAAFRRRQEDPAAMDRVAQPSNEQPIAVR